MGEGNAPCPCKDLGCPLAVPSPTLLGRPNPPAPSCPQRAPRGRRPPSLRGPGGVQLGPADEGADAPQQQVRCRPRGLSPQLLPSLQCCCPLPAPAPAAVFAACTASLGPPLKGPLLRRSNASPFTRAYTCSLCTKPARWLTGVTIGSRPPAHPPYPFHLPGSFCVTSTTPASVPSTPCHRHSVCHAVCKPGGPWEGSDPNSPIRRGVASPWHADRACSLSSFPAITHTSPHPCLRFNASRGVVSTAPPPFVPPCVQPLCPTLCPVPQGQATGTFSEVLNIAGAMCECRRAHVVGEGHCDEAARAWLLHKAQRGVMWQALPMLRSASVMPAFVPPACLRSPCPRTFGDAPSPCLHIPPLCAPA